MIGKNISHYKILDKIGEGGMGVVYRAEDINLNRTVALKFLPPQALGSEEERARFVQEAKAEATLDHTNICTIYEIEEAGDQVFIAMAYCEGQSLRDRIESGPLNLDEIVDIVVQMADGLQAAHDKGVVHRDIKPGNIVLTPKGQVKIMDFGLARLPGVTRITEPGTVKGTIEYVSPEQLKGEEPDHRADVWALGVVLYELLTGQLPFHNGYKEAVIYSILNDEPVPAVELNPAVPAELDNIVNKAIQKQVGDRYQSMKEMLDDLRQIQWRLVSRARTGIQHEKDRHPGKPVRKIIFALAAVLVVAVVIFALVVLPDRKDDIEPVSLAVFDFENHTQDTTFASILGELLRNDLHRSPHIIILSKERVQGLCKQYGIADLKLDSGFNLCRRAHIQTLVYPKIMQIGEIYHIDANVYDVNTEALLFVTSERGKGEDAIIEMVDNVSKGIIAELKLIPEQGADFDRGSPQTTTGSMEAYKLYALGYSLYEGNDPLRPIPFLEQAVAVDSTFTDAYLSLAVLCNYIGDQEALKYIQKAKAISIDKSNTTEYLKAIIVESRVQGDWDRAVEYMRHYLELHPNDINVRIDLAYVLSRRKMAFDESIAEFEKVIAFDKKNLSGRMGPAYNALGHAYLYSGRFGKALDCFTQYRHFVPNAPDPLHSTAEVFRWKGDYRQAIDMFSEIIKNYPDYYESYEDLGLVYLAAGKWRHALDEFERYINHAPRSILPWGHILRGRVYFVQQNIPMADKEIDEALAVDSLSIQAHWLRGFIALSVRNDIEEAKKELQIMEDAMNLKGVSDGRAYFYHLAGWILLFENRDEEGLDYLLQAANNSPVSFIYFTRELIRGYLIAGITGKAILEASNLLEFNENDGEVLYLLGLAHEEEDTLEEATSCFRKARLAWSEADAGFLPLEHLESKFGELP